MENDIDKYSHKLSLRNNIAYESARLLIEKYIKKIKKKNNINDDIVKSAYKFTRLNLNGGYIKKNKKFKIIYS